MSTTDRDDNSNDNIINNNTDAKLKNVIFDIGNVIVAWEPFQALQEFYATEEECHAALQELEFAAWNREQDRGRTWEEGINQLDCPTKAQIFQAYSDGLAAAHSRPVEGTSSLIDRLLQQEHVRVGGCTNASHKTVAIMKQTAPILQRLDSSSSSASSEDDVNGKKNKTAGIVVSAQEKVVKPHPLIFETCLERFEMKAHETLFVDDSLENCEGARSVGMQAHHFRSAELLETALHHYGLLI